MPDNGIVERAHKTVLDEFYRVAFRKRIYGSIAELQADVDEWIRSYNEDRAGSGFLNRLDRWSLCLTAARMAAEQERR
jgi:Integrase core domain